MREKKNNINLLYGEWEKNRSRIIKQKWYMKKNHKTTEKEKEND